MLNFSDFSLFFFLTRKVVEAGRVLVVHGGVTVGCAWCGNVESERFVDCDVKRI